jgi:hypothetical protein
MPRSVAGAVAGSGIWFFLRKNLKKILNLCLTFLTTAFTSQFEDKRKAMERPSNSEPGSSRPTGHLNSRRKGFAPSRILPFAAPALLAGAGRRVPA